MKRLANISIPLKKSLTAAALLLFQSYAWAQDKKLDVNVDVGKGGGGGGTTTWYASPWAWVIGGAVFVIVLVAILSGRNKD